MFCANEEFGFISVVAVASFSFLDWWRDKGIVIPEKIPCMCSVCVNGTQIRPRLNSKKATYFGERLFGAHVQLVV